MNRAFFLSLAIPAILTAGCMGTTVHDLSREFAADESGLTMQAPSGDSLNPALAAAPDPAMEKTTRMAETYVKSLERDDTKARYARALYACALMARGETDRAQAVMDSITPERDSNLSRDNAVIHATGYAVAACRCIDAYEAFVSVCESGGDLTQWVQKYGSFAGIDLPDADHENYQPLLERGVEQLRSRCFAVNGNDEREDARVERGRSGVRRLIGEQLYNEAASMLVVLKQPGTDTAAAPERWLATVAVGFFIVYARVIPDLLPAKLNREQKRWQRRQAMSVYDRCRRICGWFIPEAEREEIIPTSIARDIANRDEFYRYLYARLLDAEVAVVGWITTR